MGLFCFVGLVCLICWVVFVFLCFGSDFVGLCFVGERRGSWMLSSYSFSNFKMRATQILLLKLSLFSLKILRGFSMISPELCEDPSSLSLS